MGGTNFRPLRKKLTTWRNGKEWLCFHGTANQEFWVPLDTSAKYLGTIMTYLHREDKTASHRVQIARTAFSRLRRWLLNRRGLSTKKRLQLFRTCIYPIIEHGILAVGLTAHGIQHIQKHMYSMLRQVLNNHAYVTGQSHHVALAQHRVAPPCAWLLDSIDSLQRSLTTRAVNSLEHDITRQMNWDHLDQLKDQLHTILQTGPDYLIQSHIGDVPTALYTCQQCDFCTANVAHFRRHCTISHAKSMYRIHPVTSKQYSLHGLPQCKYCFAKYTTWRSFYIHIQRGCQVLIAGPAGCWHRSDRPLATDPTWPGDMLTDVLDPPVRGSHPLTEADLRNLLNQEWGSRVLTIVSSRNWHHMLKETDACQYMSTRCCLCDQFLGRIQDLHRHYKLQHPEYWPHVQAKGIQLCNLHCGEEPPCRFCNWPFKTSHQCPIWLQLAMLLIYGGGAQNPAQSSTVQRCEICTESFPNSETLHAHLVTEHRLLSTSYNAARDSFEGEPVCAHCHTMYDSLESLRSHISQNRCLSFDPTLPTEVIDVRPEWIEVLCKGKFVEQLRIAHVRLQLTLRCQHCRCKYTRPADLSGHLQAAHSALWKAAQPLLGLLVSILYEQTGCLCNPSISSHRSHHTCIPLTQLSMLYMRLHKPILYMHVPTEEELTQIYSRQLPRTQLFMLESAITAGTHDLHWTHPELLTLLRTTCILCATTLHPADLVIHLHEVHQCRQPLITFLIQQLLPHYVAAQENDFQCFACEQVYNLQMAEASPDTAAARLQATRVHLRAQCPHLLQTAIILGKAAHGTYGRRRHARIDRDDGANLDSIPEHGTADRQDPATGAEQSCTQAPKKRRTLPVRRRSGAAVQNQFGAGHDPAGQASASIGSGHAADEERGHIPFLFRQQRARQLHPSPHADHGDMGEGASAAETGSTTLCHDPAEAQIDASPLHDVAEEGGSAWSCPTGIGAAAQGPAELGSATGHDMSVFGVGSPEQAPASKSETAIDLEARASAVQRHAGITERSTSGAEVPLLAQHQQSRNHDLEASAQSEERSTLAADADALPFVNLAFDGGNAEAAQPDPEPCGSSATEHLGADTTGQRTGQREDQDQNQDGQARRSVTMPASHQIVAMQSLRPHVALLTLENPGNICFANAAMISFLWTTLSIYPCDFQSWGKQRQVLTDFLLANHDRHVNICDQSWFQDTLRCWGRLQQDDDPGLISQQDAAEFIQVWLTWLDTTAFDMRWERRLEENNRVHVFDSGGQHMPICLKFDDRLAHAHSCDLTQLMLLWCQVDGMKTAILTAPPCFCIHLDRCVADATGQISKSECMINLDSCCLIPLFQGQGLTTEPVEYQIVAIMAHLGSDGQGHYRAALRIAQTLVGDTQPAEWLLTDDWTQPVPTWRVPNWMLRTANIFWLVRTDLLQLYRYGLRMPLCPISSNVPVPATT